MEGKKHTCKLLLGSGVAVLGLQGLMPDAGKHRDTDMEFPGPGDTEWCDVELLCLKERKALGGSGCGSST